MDNKHKGSLAELIACAWLLKQGYEVFRNVSQHGVADLIVWRVGEQPFAIDVRSRICVVAKDGKTCSLSGQKTTHHRDVRFLYVFPETGHCGFDAAALVAAQGYELRPPLPPVRHGCLVDGCNGKHGARGLCRAHYERWRLGRFTHPEIGDCLPGSELPVVLQTSAD